MRRFIIPGVIIFTLVAISGRAYAAPSITVSPPSLSFGSQAVGALSAPMSVTITNNGPDTFYANGTSVTGPNPSDFFLDNSECVTGSPPIAPGSSCEILVRFKPTATGTRSATLFVLSNAAGSPHNVPLSGSGVPATPIMRLVPASHNFGSVQIGDASIATFTVSNDASATAGLTISAASVSPPSATDFVEESDACTGMTLAPNQSCLVRVRFQPATLGVKSASLVVSGNGVGSLVASLSGTGADSVPPDAEIGDVLLGVVSRLPVGTANQIRGIATDAHSGINSVTVTLEGLSSHTLIATLTCDATRRSCSWSATVPLTILVGQYTVRATARDFAGNVDPTPPSVQVLVV